MYKDGVYRDGDHLTPPPLCHDSGGSVGRLPRAEVGEAGVGDELGDVLESEDLSSGGEEELLHVLAADTEAAAGNAGNDFESRLALRAPFHAERAEVLDAGHLVAGGAVVFGELGLDDDLAVELVGHDEVGRLIEGGKPLRTLCLSVADALT